MDDSNPLGAFEDIAWPLRPKVASIIGAWSPGRNDIDDIVSDAFVKAYKAWPRFVPVDPDNVTGCVAGWLVLICKNQLINIYRKEQRAGPSRALDELEDYQRDSIESLSDVVNFDARINTSDLSATFREALMAIPAAFRQTVYLAVVEELSYLEIAEMLETPIGTVMSRLSRGRAALREVLTREDLTA